MRRKVLAAVGVGGAALFVALVPVVPATSSAAPTELGGFDNFGFAAPVSMLVFESEIPVPTTPQGELRYSYTEATLQSGPFAAGTASTVWPGPTLATGLPAFNSNLPNYPIQTTASYPGDKSQQQTSKDVPPGHMTASATGTKVVSSAQTGADSAGDPVTFGQAASTTTSTLEKSKVTTKAVATVSDLGLMGSIIQVSSVHSESEATSDGQKGSATGAQTVTGLTVAGQAFTVDDKGVHGPPQMPSVPLVDIPETGADLLKQLGISFSKPLTKKTVEGTKAQIGGQALLVSIDTKPFFNALNTLPIRTLIALTPNPCVDQLSPLPTGPCLHDQFDALLSLGPTIQFLIGNTSAASNAVPAFVFPPGGLGGTLPTVPGVGTVGTPGTPGTAGTPGVAGTATDGGSAPGPNVAGLTPLAAQLPTPFSGLGTVGLLLGLVGAGIAAYVMRGMGLPVVMGAAGGCEHGAPGSVPDLRRG